MRYLTIGILIGAMSMLSVDSFSMDLYQQQQLETLERIETSLEWIEWNQYRPSVVYVAPIKKLTKEEIRFNKCMSKLRSEYRTIYRPDLCK